MRRACVAFFFFNDTATTEIYTLSLHDALPILPIFYQLGSEFMPPLNEGTILYMPITLPGISVTEAEKYLDRKSTRLNSSHLVISYAVFCLKKKKTNPMT